MDSEISQVLNRMSPSRDRTILLSDFYDHSKSLHSENIYFMELHGKIVNFLKRYKYDISEIGTIHKSYNSEEPEYIFHVNFPVHQSEAKQKVISSNLYLN